jgi:hypothetical protein
VYRSTEEAYCLLKARFRLGKTAWMFLLKNCSTSYQDAGKSL